MLYAIRSPDFPTSHGQPFFSPNLRLLDKLKSTMASLNQLDDEVMAMYQDGIKKSFDKPWLALLGVTTLNGPNNTGSPSVDTSPRLLKKLKKSFEDSKSALGSQQQN